MREWPSDFRIANRALRRSPGFTLIAAGTLALAIAASAAIFCIVNTVLLRPLPYHNLDRLVYIAGTAPGSERGGEFPLADEFYVQYAGQAHLLESVATFNSFTSTMRAGDHVERIRMSNPTASLFTTLGAHPILGRLPTAADGDRVAVISYALWTNWFGRDRDVIGKSFSIARQSRVIIGVMDATFGFPNGQTLVWFPNVIRPDSITPGQFGQEGIVARMKPGATAPAVARELTALARRLPERFGGTPAYARVIDRFRAEVRPLSDVVLGAVRTPLLLLFGAVGLVLLIACANVANLFMVRSEERQRELAVRRAIGGTRGQLVRVQMAETLAIALISSVMAVGLTSILVPIIAHAAPPTVPRIGEVHVDRATLGFTLLLAVVATVACGLIPAIRASAPDLTRLREGGRGATGARRWVRDGLVVLQTALALALLIASGLLLRSFERLRHVNPGYDTRNVFTFQIAPEQPNLTDGPSFAHFDLAFIDRLRALPGVQSVGLIENVPLDESTSIVRFAAEGAAGGVEAGPLLHANFTAGDYFTAMQIPLRQGRVFTRDDESTASARVIVSQSAAKALFGGANPIGRRIQVEGNPGWHTVIGVVDDVRQDDFRDETESAVYFPLIGPTPDAWAEVSPGYVIKTPRAAMIAPEVRALVREVAPEAPMYRIHTMADLAARSMARLSFTMLTVAFAAILALVLGVVGLYGVLSYLVARRTREIGIRMALGATATGKGGVRRLVIMQGLRVVAVGVAAGLAIALIAGRTLGALLYGVGHADVLTFVAMSILMFAVAVAASYIPARRASAIDPIEALRRE